MPAQEREVIVCSVASEERGNRSKYRRVVVPARLQSSDGSVSAAGQHGHLNGFVCSTSFSGKYRFPLGIITRQEVQTVTKLA